MKRLLIFVLCICALTALRVSASAATTETTVANSLYSLGLVSGYDDAGEEFGLSDSLTRAQAVVLIERYLGVVDEALASNEKSPFDDVPAWADAYVSYAYKNDLIKGVGGTKFAPDTAISEAEFLTLLLRAMEYSDAAGDFVWSDPFAFAKSLGLIDHTAATGNFLRGAAFMTCYKALESATKSGTTVAEKLTAAGVITEKAYGYAKRIADGEVIVVACVGDSVTQGTGSSNASKYSYPAQLQKLLGKGFLVVNCGKASSFVTSLSSATNYYKTQTDLWYPNTAAYKTLMESDADIVIVMLGTNDARSMTAESAKTDFINSYQSLIAQIQGLPTNPEIYLSTNIPAVNASVTYEGTVYTLPRLIREIGEKLDLPVIETGEALHDYYSAMLTYNDSVHPTDETYPALAVHFYNQVFGHSMALPELPKAQGDVVYVSSSGKKTNGGTSPADAVDTIGLAVAMLRETGGTVVVSGPLTFKETYFVACAAPVTITSVYGGVDYRKTNQAKLTVSGNLTLASDFVFENLTLYSTLSAARIFCCYHNLTIGEGMTWSGAAASTVPMAISAGYCLSSNGLLPEDVSCHEDCTLTVSSGTWALVRGGNFRTVGYAPIGTVDPGVKLSVIINGGNFTFTGTNANTAGGMNGCDGELYMEINGGTFVGGVYGVCRIGTNTTGVKPTFSGNITVKLTGGTLNGGFGLYQTSDTPAVTGNAKLILSESMSSYKDTANFTSVEILK